MENLNNMNRTQLGFFISKFEFNAFNMFACGAYQTAGIIEKALKNGDTTNAVPTATPSTLAGRPLTSNEIQTINIDKPVINNNPVSPEAVDGEAEVTRVFAETYACLHDIELSESVLNILARVAAWRADLFALPLDSVEGRALTTLWGIPAQPSFADNLALYQAHKVISLNGNVYRMKPLSVKVA